MHSVRRYSLAVIAFAALATGCQQGHRASIAPVAPASPQRVVASVVSAPAPVRLTRARLVTRSAVTKHVALPTHHTVKPAIKSVIKPAAAKLAAPKPVAPTTVTAPAPSSADNYPYRSATTNANDPWGFTERQCVSYLAWRLSQAGHGISNQKDGWGSALTWDDTARRLGFAVNSTPAVGSVAQWNAGESSVLYSGSSRGTFTAGGYGHVGYVTAVYSDGSVQVAQYNVQGDRQFSTLRMVAPRYLHVG